ncbi:MAG: dipeptidase PepE [Bacteroidales bacterium]|jgi:dipeptidase E|nr:dipeptidase PepE [Bacteroidales bacterium]
MKLLLISNSTNYKESYLSWCMPLIEQFLKNEKRNILFFPYAGIKIGGKNHPDSYDAYLERVQTIFAEKGFHVISVHQAKCPVEAVNRAEIIMVGGGNTFNLVAEIHKYKLIEPVRRKVMEGTPFFGWSAGSNVACPTLRTTNDMPIIMPESFQCFDLVPFQINPHYIDPYPQDVNDKIRHGGETRQDRIDEFLALNPEITVAGLREATALWVENEVITLKGSRNLRIMRHLQESIEIEPESKFDYSFNKI